MMKLPITALASQAKFTGSFPASQSVSLSQHAYQIGRTPIAINKCCTQYVAKKKLEPKGLQIDDKTGQPTGYLRLARGHFLRTLYLMTANDGTL